MSWRFYLFFSVLGLACAFFVASFQRSPGYMDADYYFAGGTRLAGGYGFNEEILWNFLDDAVGLPHPSHGYWMPLVSILASLGMALRGSTSFQAARIPFLFLMASVPPLTGALAWRLHKRRQAAWLAASLALLPAFYLPFLPTTDGFGLTMVLGGSFFLLMTFQVGDLEHEFQAPWRNLLKALALGVLAGLLYLTRVDGALWLAFALIALSLKKRKIVRGTMRWDGMALLICLAGFFLVSLPWMARNWSVFGTIFSPGGSRALWITDYDELFIYPASLLTPQRWFSSGAGAILRARLWSAGQNLQSALAVQGAIFLTPLILAGMWRMRRNRVVQIAAIAWAVIFAVMTLVFPFQGARGGFFHSGAALQPLFWAIAPAGLTDFVDWGARHRGWRKSQAEVFFSLSLIGLSLLLSAFVAYHRFRHIEDGTNAWNRSFVRYSLLEAELQRRGFTHQEIMMVNNSPGYYIASQRRAISIPYADLSTVCAAAHRYRVTLLVLEIDQIPGASELFSNPSDRLCLRYLGTFEDVRIFQVHSP